MDKLNKSVLSEILFVQHDSTFSLHSLMISTFKNKIQFKVLYMGAVRLLNFEIKKQFNECQKTKIKTRLVL